VVKMCKLKKNNIWRLPAKNRVPLPSGCCLELWGLFTGDVGISPLLLLLLLLQLIWFYVFYWCIHTGIPMCTQHLVT